MNDLEKMLSGLAGTKNVFSYNWAFLVCFLVLIIAVIFYVYYIDRLFAFVFTKVINFFLFKKVHVIIDIEALHISLLFGTIQFKNLAIITKDSTVSIVQGTFQWKFWMLRSWLSSNDHYDKHLDQEKQAGKSIFLKNIYKLVKESRNFINIEGLEVFIYNNSSAYYRIFHEVMTDRDREILIEKYPILVDIFGPQPSTEKKESSNKKAKASHDGSSVYNVSLIDQLLDSFLPFVINIRKGSIVIGTSSTKYLLVTNWTQSQTLLHGIKSENSLDLYQLRLNTSNENLKMVLSPNPLYRNLEEIDQSEFSNVFLRNGKNIINFIKHGVSHKIDKIKHRKANLKNDMIEKSHEWTGLAMYTHMINFDEKEDDLTNVPHQSHLKSDTENSLPFVEEYAKYSTILECSNLSHVYYFDIPGYVPETVTPTMTDYQGPGIGNSGSAPEMRLDIQLSDSQIIIGPWAYRNVMPIISLLFPGHSRDNKVAEILSPGDRRKYTRFKLFIDIQENCNFRIPTREKSKDAEFIRETESFQNSKMNFNTSLPLSTKLIRPYGWIDLAVSEGTSFFFDFNYFPIDGKNKGSYRFDLMEPKITTSVNHELLYSAEFHSLIWESFAPLVREDTIVNSITQTTNNSKCNMLREHINLITDLANDFGLPIENIGLEDQYQTFSPQDYNFTWRFKDGYNLMVAVNDENIINSASDYGENNIISFVGDSSELELNLPFKMLQQTSNNVDFRLKTKFYDICLNTPSYSTISAFSENNRIARGRNLDVSGHFEFFNGLSLGNIDNFELIFDTEELNVLFYGFVIKYFTNFYENLFGETCKFKTADEYQEQIFQDTKRVSDVFSTNMDQSDWSSESTKRNTEPVVNYLEKDSSQFEANKLEDQNDTNTLVLNKEDLKRTENEIDITVKFNIRSANMYFPEKLMSVGDSTSLHTENMEVDIRALDYYFDLLINGEPIYICENIGDSESSSEVLLNRNFFTSDKFGKEKGILTHLSCHNHSLSGPVPINVSYFSKWDFSIGTLMLDGNLSLLKKLITTVTNFDFSLDDFDNKLIVDKIESYGIEFDSFEIEGIDVKLHDEDITINITADGITFDYREYERNGNSTLAKVNVESLDLSCEKNGELVFNFSTEIDMEKTFRYSNYKERKEKQKSLLIKNDAPFHRIWFLLPLEFRNYYIYQNSLGFIKTGQSIPNLPIPVTNETGDSIIEDYINFANSKQFSLEERKQLLRKKILATETMDLFPLDYNPTNDAVDGKNKKTLKLNFNNTAMNLDIAKLDVWNYLLEQLTQNDCESILDSIYIDIIKNLFLKENIEASDQIVDVVFERSKIKVMNSEYSQDKYIVIETSPINVKVEVSKRFELKNNSITNSVTKSILLATKRMSLALYDECNENVALKNNIRFVLDSFSYQLINEGESDVKKFDFGTFNNLLNIQELEILFELFTQNIDSLSNEISSLSKTVQTIQSREKELVLQLLLAGNQYGIDYDPPVISKLSPIVRLSKTHVRDNRSWRICARLRHILKNVPENWENEFMDRINKHEFTPHALAVNEFFNCFKKWINIEKQVTESTYLYRRIFLNENNVHEIQSSKGESFQLFFKSIVFKILSDQDGISDSIIFKELNFNVGNDLNTNKQLKVISDFNFVGGRIGLGTILLLEMKNKIMVKFNEKKMAVKLDDSFSNDATSEVSIGGSLVSHVNELLKVMLEITIKKVKLDFDLDNQELEVINHDTQINLDLNRLDEFTSNVKSGLSNLAFKRKHYCLLKSSISGFDMKIQRLFNELNSKYELKINTDINTLNLINPEDTVKTIFILENIHATYQKYKQTVNDLVLDKPNNEKKKIETGFSDIVYYEGTIKNFKTSTNVLEPFIVETKTSNLSLSIDNAQENIRMILDVESFTIDISSVNSVHHYLLITQKNMHTSASIGNSYNSSKAVCDLDFALNKCKFLVYDMRSTGEKLATDLLKVFEQIDFIKEKINTYGTVKDSASSDLEMRTEQNVLFNFGITIDYIGLLFDFSAQQLISEMEKTVIGIRNYKIMDGAELSATIHSLWYYAIDSLSVSINDKMLDHSQSKVFNTSLSGSVSEADVNQKLDLNLESKFFNVMFTPYSFVRMMWFINQFEYAYNITQSDGMYNENIVKQTSNDCHLGSSANFLEKFNKINFFSKDFALGWIYSNQSGNENNWTENGLVFGYESLSLSHHSMFGKVVLKDLYFGVTPFAKYYNFYNVIKSVNFINFVRLPVLKTDYKSSTVSSKNFRNLTVDVFGDNVHMIFGENVISVVEHILESIYDLKTLESRYINKKPVMKKKECFTTVNDNIKFFESLGFYEIESSVVFSGGFCSILSHKDFLDSREPTIVLHSPKVTINLAYEFKEMDRFKHVISLNIQVDDSENILYPTSVPVFQRIAKDTLLLNSFLKNNDNPQNHLDALKSPIFENDVSTETAIDFKNILENFDIHCGVNCGSQEIALTCEPKAKVQAVLGVKRMLFTADNTEVDGGRCISLFFESEKLLTKIHHIFSDSISTYFQLSKFSLHGFLSGDCKLDQENLFITTASSLDAHIDITQIQNLNLFFDIWSTNSSLTKYEGMDTGNSMRPELHNRSDDIASTDYSSVSLMSIFDKYYTESTFAMYAMFILKDVKCIIDFGPALGLVTLNGNNLWFEFTQYKNWSKELTLNLNKISLSSKGRLQGLIELRGFNVETLLRFQDLTDFAKCSYSLLDSMPDMKLHVKMQSLKSTLSFDYHAFLLTEFSDWSFKILNEKENGVPTIKMFVELNTIELYGTALVTANLLSIHSSFEKIKSENLRSYYDTLYDSNTVTNVNTKLKASIQAYVENIKKTLYIKIGSMYIQVSPHSLSYPQVLIIENKNTVLNFVSYGVEKIFNEVEISTEELVGRVAKSATESMSEDDLIGIPISMYQEKAKQSTGGTIVSFPAIMTKMSTWNTKNSNTVEYIYNSVFGGLVSIKWNLGPIGFIREIWSTHAVALKQVNQARVELSLKEETEEKKKTSFFEEENIDDRIKEIELNDKFEFKPLVVPIIDIPNLKDLGNATPPLKWFGINKEKFPGVIYEAINEPLGNLLKQVEKEYGKKIEKM